MPTVKIKKAIQDCAVQMLGQDVRLEKLQGGINGDVYKIERDFYKLVIKHYPRTVFHSERNLLLSELEFLRYCAEVAPNFVPKVVDLDEENRCLVIEYINGKLYQSTETLEPKDLERAGEFINRINVDLEAAKAYVSMDAAEGYLSIREHLLNVQQRIEELTANCLPEELQTYGSHLLNLFLSKWHAKKEKIEIKLENRIFEDSISERECCLSPSDFGFHNAIKAEDRGAVFIDFEYAGWDDPSKTLIDIFLQPRVQVNKRDLSYFIKFKHKFLPKGLNSARHLALYDILYFKWVAIILAILNPKRLKELSMNSNLINTNYKFVVGRLAEAERRLRALDYT